MFKTMRRQDRALGNEDIAKILAEGLYGVLSVSTKDGYAYGVPLSYVWLKGNIYFHAAQEGQKLEAICENSKVSFCVVGKVETLPAKFSTKYESVILFGEAGIVEGMEKEEALFAMIEKYAKEYSQEGQDYIKKAKEQTTVVKIAVQHCTGKARR